MDAGAVQGLLWLWTLLFVAALCLLVAWIVLPFAVLGTKPLLRDLVSEQRRTNELLERLLAPRGAAGATPAAAPAVPDVRRASADDGRRQQHPAHHAGRPGSTG